MRQTLRRRGLLAGSAALGGVVASGLAAAELAPPGGQRQDIATLAPDRLAVLEAAVGEMQARSRANPDDPAGWRANMMAHRAACSSLGEPMVHGNWWFLPWHRAFLAVTELKLQAVSGDRSLRLPYWNWSSDRQIPASFARPGSALAQASRFTPDRALRAAEVDDLGPDPDSRRLGVAALGAASFEPFAAAAIPFAFGGMAEPNPWRWRGRSRLEGVPHGALHNYVGGEAADGSLGDMTELATAALDPVFFAHHANLDRLWEIWRSDARRRATEPSVAAFVDRKFVFSWLDGTPIVIRVGDVLDTAHFGYAYDCLTVMREDGVPDADVRLDVVPLVRQALPSPGLRAGQRATLTITGVAAGDRPANAEVVLAPQDDPDRTMVVGGIATGRKHGILAYPDTEWHFDITPALWRQGPGGVVASVLPLGLGREIKPPVFVCGGMEITVSE